MTNSRAGQLLRILIGSLLVAALSNCGLKGDLYLPEPEKAASDVTQDEATADKADAASAASQTDESNDDDEDATPEQPTGAASLP